MKICYYFQNGTEYAKLPGESVRKNGSVYKKNVIYLGKVADKEKHIFWKRDTGYYVYDPDTGDRKALPDYMPPDDRKGPGSGKGKILDFGDTYVCRELIRKMKYEQVLDSLEREDKDTLFALVCFYTLEAGSCMYASAWLKGNAARILFPGAQLEPPQIQEILARIGQDKRLHSFFHAQRDWITKFVCEDAKSCFTGLALPDSQSLQNRRLIVALQKESGFPLSFSPLGGTIADAPSDGRFLNRSKEYVKDPDRSFYEMKEQEDTDLTEWGSMRSGLSLKSSSAFERGKEALVHNLSEFAEKSRLVSYGGKEFLCRRIDFAIGNQEAFLYLCIENGRFRDPKITRLQRILSVNSDAETLLEELQKQGFLVLISPCPYQEDSALPAYFSRRIVERYFSFRERNSNLKCFLLQSPEILYGHLALSMVAATIQLYLIRKTGEGFDWVEDLFLSLRNQKCIVHKTRISIEEPDAQTRKFYEKFDLAVPSVLSFPAGGDLK